MEGDWAPLVHSRHQCCGGAAASGSRNSKGIYGVLYDSYKVLLRGWVAKIQLLAGPRIGPLLVIRLLEPQYKDPSRIMNYPNILNCFAHDDWDK